MRKLRTSSAFNLHCHEGEDFAAYIRKGLQFFKETGFDAADFPTTMLDLSSDAWRVQVEGILAHSEQIGMHFELCHLPFGGPKSVMQDAFQIKMHNAIDAAKMLGVRYAVLHPNTTTLPLKQYNRAAQFDAVMAHLAPFVEHASRVGLNVVVENMRVVPGMMLSHRYCQAPDELCDVADALGIGVCWDFGHANISAVKQSEGLAYVGKRLKVLHVNDNTAIEDEHLAPFMGNVNWRDAMHGLALAEFDGLFNFELTTKPIPPTLRRQYAAFLKSAAKELMSYIE